VAVRGAAQGRVGEVLVRGPQLFSGYWPGDRRSGATDRPGWHATGDRGFLHRGQLFVIGRADDVLVHHGRQFYPADVVAACADVTGLRPGRCAAVMADRADASADRVCLVAEAEDRTAPAELAGLVRRRLVQALDLYVSEVVLLAPGELPVTTSGKVRVAETGRLLRRGLLPPPRPGSST
jgi:acyl-CoA synthetase (AMP-forming)/AMP-acid ligase II